MCELLYDIVGLVIAGIVIEVTHTKAVQSYIFFIAGAICLIPGGMVQPITLLFFVCVICGLNILSVTFISVSQ